jgi:hypothetical protein
VIRFPFQSPAAIMAARSAAGGAGLGPVAAEWMESNLDGRFMQAKSRWSARRHLVGRRDIPGRRVLFGLIVAAPLALLAGPVASASAMLVMEKPLGGTVTNVTTPTFSGTTEDTSDPVTVVVHEGTSITGPPLPPLTAPVSLEGTWSVTSESLPDGSYTAEAEQTETGGMGETLTAGPVTFTIDTKPPAVTLKQPPSPSGDTTPVFEGSASESSAVTIDIYAGPKAEGEVAASATAEGNGGKWISRKASPALTSGEYTAVAIQESSIDNGPGESLPVHFVVDTESPTVTLKQPTTPSKDRTPSFTGTATADTEVVIHIYEGTEAKGAEVATAEAGGTGGTWSSDEASPTLKPGYHYYTAVATQQSPLGNEGGKSEPKTFLVDTESPGVTLNQPPKLSNETEPSFSGTATGEAEVVVQIYPGSKAEGLAVATATAPASGGGWATTPEELSKALPTGKHSFTAVAKEKSAVGNPEGRSEERTFEVDTATPAVTLNQPTKLSKDTTPSFGGTASEETEVEVYVYEGAKAEGTAIVTAKTTASGGGWATTPEELSKALPTGKHSFTAVAKEKSALGNGEGRSEERTFEVNTEGPSVTLNQPTKLSKDITPSFSGTASEATELVVYVYEGGKAEGTPVASAKTMASGGSWATTAEELSNALPGGKHTFTAVAKEKSGLGNGEGTSEERTFEVNTNPPAVTLAQPAKLSGETKPSFSGSASEDTEVVVRVYEGSKAEGTAVATAKTTASGGSWATTPEELSKALPEGRHTFTAVAKEKSGLGNGEGTSEERIFEVSTNSPTVTLNQPPKLSAETKPSFSGSATEATEVVVRVYEGGKAEGTPVATAKTTASNGSWATTAEQLSKALPSGKHTFTAVAKEKSGLGNGEGTSEERTFEVNTNAPSVTLAKVASPTKNTTPSFSGTASEATEVEVRVYEGSKVEGTPLASAKTTASGGSWATTAEQLSNALPGGRRTFTAVAKEKSGLGNGEGTSEERTFEVNTEPPAVTLTQPKTPTSETEPSFSGTASENTEVVVHVFEGSAEVANAKTTASDGTWSTSGSALSKALLEGKHTYTVYAIEKSGLGNKEGTSETRTFEVDTEAPTVTLAKVPPRTNETSPSFSGTASENTEVVVHVFEGSTEVANAKTTASDGTWSTTGKELSKALPTGKHTFTVYATEKSGLGNGTGTSAPQTFEVDTDPPSVTLAKVSSPTNNVEPSFSGTASEDTEVVVRVYEGAKVEGTPVASAKTTAAGGSWSTNTEDLSKALPGGKHTFTAIAVEKSGVGNGEGQSEERTFEVNTNPPAVTLAKVPSPTSDVEPSFSGTASENTEVVVRVYEGAKVEGSPVASAKTTAAGGNWSTNASALSNALPKGKRTFTAVAMEKSGLNNGEGRSEERTFVVNTEPPVVSLNQPTTPSKETKPSFGGNASEDTEVVVHVFEGSKAEGPEFASAKTTGSGGSWSTSASALSKALPEGKHTFSAYATEASGLNNGPGKSAIVVFEVNTEPPVVSLNTPPTPSKETKPAFSGNASEDSEVVVHVFEGSKAEGPEFASAKTTGSGGSWSTSASALSKALLEGKHTFSAYATEVSGLGNKPGKSATVVFEVNTEPPVVTLNQPKTPSNNTKPSFSGTASETGPAVTVDIYEGKKAEGTPVTSTTASGGRQSESWTAPGLSKELPTGKHVFTAIATEPSGLGNKEGESKPVTFEVDTLPPTVTLESPALVSNETTPSFSGTASEAGQITVALRGETVKGKKVEDTLLASVTAKEGGSWKTPSVNPPLEEGQYTVVASEPSGLENGVGKSEERSFKVELGAPKVELNPVPRSRNTEPSFSGTASDKTPVTVDIYEGESATGTIVATATEQGARKGTAWTSAKASPALPIGRHTFTAVAVEASELKGNPNGESNAVTFEVDTDAPTVSLNQLETPSNQTKPSFSGAASEATEVAVHVYAGSKPEGAEVDSATTTAAEGHWSVSLVKALQEGKHTFTAYATEKSAISGNEEGRSAPVTFEVNTLPPTVTLNPVPSPANDAQPSFSGTASETTPITVSVYEGSATDGNAVAAIEAEGTGGEWSSGKLGSPRAKGNSTLPNGEYTAIARQPSSLGNPEGVSPAVTFVVETLPPKVVAQPATIISRTQVQLNASVNPNEGALSACGFEYGTSPAYGSSAECAFTNASGECAFSATALGACEFPSDEGPVPVYARVFNPSPSTTYYFRITAANGDQAESATGTFTTPAALHFGGPGTTGEGPSGPSNTGTISTAHNAIGEVEAAIAAHLPPSGREATIAALLKNGGFASVFKAPQAGTALIDWYYLPPGAKLAAKAAGKKRAPAPVLVASGKRTFYEAGSGVIKVRLTAAGKKLLRRSKRIRLTAKAVFTSPGKAAIAATKAFELK